MYETNPLKQKIFAFACCFLVAASAFGAQPESHLVSQARELVDTYYGDQANFTKATELLEQAYLTDPKDANVFVQAARITVLGGVLTFGRYQEGTFERYSALIDSAIELDPANPKAHMLKAQVFFNAKKHDQELASLEKAKATNTADPWLQIGYGRHHRATGSLGKALEYYTQVQNRGPGGTPSERRAYIVALDVLTSIQVDGEDMLAKLRQHAALALQNRYPRDAWTPHGYAETFLDNHLYDDAIFYAREALKTMDFGFGRLALAASLYAKAAQLHTEGRAHAELKPIINEAQAFGFHKDDVLEYLVKRRGIKGSYGPLVPALEKVIQ